MSNSILQTTFLGIPMNTPIMGASGTFGFGFEYMPFLQMKYVGRLFQKVLRRYREKEMQVCVLLKRHRGCLIVLV